MSYYLRPAETTFKQMTDASIYQTVPVQNTWYTVLPSTLNARIKCVDMRVNTTSENLECQIIVDGVTITFNQASAGAGTWYHSQSFDRYNNNAIIGGDSNGQDIVPIEGRNVQVRIRKTTANGTGTLECRVRYDVLT
jgi:hypothetical protein